MNWKTINGAIAIITIGFLEWQAIVNNLDGYYFSIVIGAIAGIAGYKIAKLPTIPK
jgi:hypothetical protein